MHAAQTSSIFDPMSKNKGNRTSVAETLIGFRHRPHGPPEAQPAGRAVQRHVMEWRDDPARFHEGDERIAPARPIASSDRTCGHCPVQSSGRPANRPARARRAARSASCNGRKSPAGAGGSPAPSRAGRTDMTRPARRQIGRADIDPGIFVDFAAQEARAVGAFFANDLGPLDQVGRLIVSAPPSPLMTFLVS